MLCRIFIDLENMSQSIGVLCQAISLEVYIMRVSSTETTKIAGHIPRSHSEQSKL